MANETTARNWTYCKLWIAPPTNNAKFGFMDWDHYQMKYEAVRLNPGELNRMIQFLDKNAKRTYISHQDKNFAEFINGCHTKGYITKNGVYAEIRFSKEGAVNISDPLPGKIEDDVAGVTLVAYSFNEEQIRDFANEAGLPLEELAQSKEDK